MSLVNEELRVVVVGGSGHRVCVRIEGELDVATAPLLREVFDAAMASEVGDVDVDMSTTTFCDSAGLTVLLAAQHEWHPAGRRLRLVHASTPVLRLLDLSGTRALLGPHEPTKPIRPRRATCTAPVECAEAS